MIPSIDNDKVQETKKAAVCGFPDIVRNRLKLVSATSMPLLQCHYHGNYKLLTHFAFNIYITIYNKKSILTDIVPLLLNFSLALNQHGIHPLSLFTIHNHYFLSHQLIFMDIFTLTSKIKRTTFPKKSIKLHLYLHSDTAQCLVEFDGHLFGAVIKISGWKN